MLQFKALDQQIAESLSLPRTLAALADSLACWRFFLPRLGCTASCRAGLRAAGPKSACASPSGRLTHASFAWCSARSASWWSQESPSALHTLAAAKSISAFLCGVQPEDPTTLAASMLLLCLVGVGAALIPAVRAGRLNAVEALNSDQSAGAHDGRFC